MTQVKSIKVLTSASCNVSFIKINNFTPRCTSEGSCYLVNASTWLGPLEMVEPVYGWVMPFLMLFTFFTNTLIIIGMWLIFSFFTSSHAPSQCWARSPWGPPPTPCCCPWRCVTCLPSCCLVHGHSWFINQKISLTLLSLGTFISTCLRGTFKLTGVYPLASSMNWAWRLLLRCQHIWDLTIEF